MKYWLMKTEPETFSYDDLARLGRDCWNGVRNFRALGHMKQMSPGDEAFIYHTGKEKAIIGIAAVASFPYPDPNEADARLLVVDVEPRIKLIRPVSLRELKSDPRFAAWELTRLPRLSVMPVPPDLWRAVLDLAAREKDS